MTIERLRLFSQKHPAVRTLLLPGIMARRFWHQRENQLAARMIEILVDDPTINVKEFEGVFAIGKNSHLLQRLLANGEYEPKQAACCRKFLDPHKDVIDVGANVGFYAVMFAKNIADNRRVLAIEPTETAYGKLLTNIDRNGVASRTLLFKGLASNKSGMSDIKAVPGKEEYSTMGELAHPSIADEHYVTQTVPMSTIDELVAQNSLEPGFMKVDVEGAEYLVFEGARKTLEQKRPIILSELSEALLKATGSSSMDVVRFIEASGYTVLDPLFPSQRPGSRPSGDIMCFPEEMQIGSAEFAARMSA